MAKITTGPIVAEIRGKCGDVIFSRNRGSMYSQRVHVRIAPWSATVEYIRTVFALTSTLWNLALSDEQRRAWNELAPTLPHTDKLRQCSPLSGQQLFQKLNMTHQYWFGSYIPDPPKDLSTSPTPEPSVVTIEAQPQKLIVATIGTQAPRSLHLRRNQQPQRRRIKFRPQVLPDHRMVSTRYQPIQRH